MNAATAPLRVADETWIATALLHIENPNSEDFTVAEIVERARRENITGHLRPGVYIHANTHAVANRPPQPSTLRMLFETAPNRRRLFRQGDESHAKREGKTKPEADQIPDQYRYLLDWYDSKFAPKKQERWLQGAFDMIGVGR